MSQLLSFESLKFLFKINNFLFLWSQLELVAFYHLFKDLNFTRLVWKLFLVGAQLFILKLFKPLFLNTKLVIQLLILLD